MQTNHPIDPYGPDVSPVVTQPSQDHRGPAINTQSLDLSQLQLLANGAPLVIATRVDDQWHLPYPPADDGVLRFDTQPKLIDHVVWDARQLAQDVFATCYPNYVPVTVRELDDSLVCVERAGTRLAFVHRDPDTHRWHVSDAARRRHTHSGTEFRDTGVEFVLGRVTEFAEIAAQHEATNRRPTGRARSAGAA